MKKILITYIIFLFSIQIFAQFTIDGATLSIQENAFLASPINIENYGSIYNSGTIFLEADWLNSSFYDTTGTLYLNGENHQNIQHNNQNFNVLVIDGVGEKLLLSDAKILTELSLINGLLKVEEGNNLVLTENAITTNSSENSYVNGLLFNEGVGYKFFPIGKDNLFSPIELINIENYSIVGIEMFYPNLKLEANPLLTVSDSRYYEISYLNGNNINSKISLGYDETYNPSDYDNLVVVQANEGEDFESLGNNFNSGINVRGVTSSEIATKKYYTLALLGKLDIDLFIPSALSVVAPNEEDRVVKIYGDNFSENDFIFMVYNKWGNLIFSTNSLEYMQNTGWNGNNQNTGKPESNGMYSYIIKAIDAEGKKLEKTGTIMIIN